MRISKPIAIGLVVVGLAATGCSQKNREPFRDAGRGAVNDAPADFVTFPDGFSNVSSKCDGPNRVYVVYHGDAAYGAMAVVANDPRCTK